MSIVLIFELMEDSNWILVLGTIISYCLILRKNLDQGESSSFEIKFPSPSLQIFRG